jgi:hypothetical protein
LTVSRQSGQDALVKRTLATLAIIVGALLPLSLFAQSIIVTVDGDGVTVGNGAAAPGSPYPSIINITDSFGTILDLNVILHGVSHTFSDDFDILLLGPNGAAVMLLSDTGGSHGMSGVELTFDDSAAGELSPSAQIVSGTYRPSNNGGGADNMPAPAPNQQYLTVLSAFNGIEPTGDWQLFIADDRSGDGGLITGWSLQFTLAAVPEPSTWALMALGLGSVFFARRRFTR